jgi:membrane-associated phospholipid phosphatase
MNSLRQLDDRILTDVNVFARHTGWLHGAVLGHATYGLVLFAALLLVGLWLIRTGSNRALAAAGWAPLAVLLAVALNQPLVSGIAEGRPYTSHPGLLVLATRSSGFSFPSDHAVMAGAAAAALWLVSRTLGAIATVAAPAMASARVYIAAHYPWDVVAGLVFGALVALVGWLLLRALLTAITGWLRRRPGVRQVFPAPALEQVPGSARTTSGASAA